MNPIHKITQFITGFFDSTVPSVSRTSPRPEHWKVQYASGEGNPDPKQSAHAAMIILAAKRHRALRRAARYAKGTDQKTTFRMLARAFSQYDENQAEIAADEVLDEAGALSLPQPDEVITVRQACQRYETLAQYDRKTPLDLLTYVNVTQQLLAGREHIAFVRGVGDKATVVVIQNEARYRERGEAFLMSEDGKRFDPLLEAHVRTLFQLRYWDSTFIILPPL